MLEVDFTLKRYKSKTPAHVESSLQYYGFLLMRTNVSQRLLKSNEKTLVRTYTGCSAVCQIIRNVYSIL